MVKAVCVNGPWAFYEARHNEQEEQIQRLQSELTYWKALGSSSSTELRELRHRCLELGSANEGLEQRMSELTDELAETRAAMDTRTAELTSSLEQLHGTLGQEVERLRLQNAELMSKLWQLQLVKESTGAKLSKAREKLGLNEAEARRFLQDLDDAKSKCSQLQSQQSQLRADHAALQEQCSSRSQHCLVLLEDNKRLRNQLQAAVEKQLSAREALQRAVKLTGMQPESSNKLHNPARPAWQSLQVRSRPQPASSSGADDTAQSNLNGVTARKGAR